MVFICFHQRMSGASQEVFGQIYWTKRAWCTAASDVDVWNIRLSNSVDSSWLQPVEPNHHRSNRQSSRSMPQPRATSWRALRSWRCLSSIFPADPLEILGVPITFNHFIYHSSFNIFYIFCPYHSISIHFIFVAYCCSFASNGSSLSGQLCQDFRGVAPNRAQPGWNASWWIPWSGPSRSPFAFGQEVTEQQKIAEMYCSILFNTVQYT